MPAVKLVVRRQVVCPQDHRLSRLSQPSAAVVSPFSQPLGRGCRPRMPKPHLLSGGRRLHNSEEVVDVALLSLPASMVRPYE